jgi:hypothetical protein
MNAKTPRRQGKAKESRSSGRIDHALDAVFQDRRIKVDEQAELKIRDLQVSA